MAQIAVFLPRESMLAQAEQVIRDQKFDIKKVQVIETVDAVSKAREAIEEGIQIIVARGVQARLIKKLTNIPVIDITLSAQELGLLVVEAKKIVKKARPQLAIIGFDNMISDISYFDQLFDVQMKCYYVDEFDEMEEAVETAVLTGADLILGGDTVNRIVENYSIPAMFLSSTEDSIRNALFIAQKMSYAIDVEQSSNAQLETMLDTAFNGIVKIDKERRIIVMNHLVETLLGKQSKEVAGQQLEVVLNGLEPDAVNQILNGSRDTYSTSVKVKGTPLLFLIAPIKYDEQITGAIVSCSKIKVGGQTEAKTIQEIYLNGYRAKSDFYLLKSEEPVFRECVELGKKYALSRRPVLIIGEAGTEKECFAQCIHNNSGRRNGPFLAVNANTVKNEEGMYALLKSCNHGTLYIDEVDALSVICQYELYKLIQSQDTTILGEMSTGQPFDVRIMVAAKRELGIYVSKGSFREDLFYSLNGLAIQIPPLRKRKRDIPVVVQSCLKQFAESYRTFLQISDEAMEVLVNYRWEGNLIQLESFCERLCLTTAKKNIDEAVVRNLLERLYPKIREVENEERLIVIKHPEALELTRLLEKHGGNRNAVASELQISTTTLWRRMKKYGILNKYNI